MAKSRTYRFPHLGLTLILLLVLVTAVSAERTCQHCGAELGGAFVQYNGKLYHSECYLEHIAPRCGICNEPLDNRWIIYDGQGYHQSCYEEHVALRCSVCNGIITGEYLVDHWGNKYHAYHRKDIEACSFCGRLLSDPEAGGGHAFDEVHTICNACSRDAVTDEPRARRLLKRANELMARAGIGVDLEPIEFKLVSREELTAMAGQASTNRFGLIHYETTTTWSMLTERKFTICILEGQPSRHMISVAAHELMHVWLYLNAVDAGDPALVEGSCNYAAYLVLRQIGDNMAGYVMEQLLSDSDLVYGEGFRRVKKLVENRGTKFWLEHLKFDPDFPIGY